MVENVKGHKKFIWIIIHMWKITEVIFIIHVETYFYK